MNESLLVFLWKYRVLGNVFNTSDGEEVCVFLPGTQNKDGGPDFLNARLKIGDTLWAGNVEIHWKSSDWNKHGHHQDPVYDSVILHVSMHHDVEVYTSSGRKLSTLSLYQYAGESVIQKYSQLTLGHEEIPCLNILEKEKILLPGPWLTRLAVERLESKAKQFIQQYMWEGGDWDKTFFLQLFRCYGLPVNAEPFVRLGRKFLSIKGFSELSCHESEALLFCLSGLISPGAHDSYISGLYNLGSSFLNGLPTLPAPVWKFLRLRPNGFPTVRIAQMAIALHHLSKTTHDQRINMEIQDWRELFSHPASDYWHGHFLPGKLAQRPWPKKPGRQFVDSLIINIVAPYLAAVAHYENRSGVMARSLGILEACGPEDNRIIRQWVKAGLHPKNATDSQGLIELAATYCNQHQCLRCRIGYILLHSA